MLGKFFNNIVVHATQEAMKAFLLVALTNNSSA